MGGRAGAVTVKRLKDECRLLGRTVRAPQVGASGPASPPPSDAQWFASLRRDRGAARERVLALGREAVAGVGGDAWLRLRLPGDLAADFAAAVEARRRRLAEQAVVPAPEESAFTEDGSRAGAGAIFAPEPAVPSLAAARSFSIRGQGVPAWAGLLAMLEDFVETWDPPAVGRRRPDDEVYARFGFRCAAPGCTSRRNLEDHHVVYRSRGGGDEPANRVCLCRFHHQRGEHGGLASCRGRAPLGIVWTLGRGGIGGRFRNERALAGPAL